MPEADIYPRVRALERGLELIGALSDLGWATPGELAKYTGIHRATVYRLLFTLEQAGYVYLRSGDGRYFLTKHFRRFADSVKDEDWVVQVIGPYMGRLLAQVQWPSDFATFTSGHLEIRESTHRFSPMSVNRAMVGKTRPLLRSAMGIAILSEVADESLEQMLDLASLVQPDGVSKDEMRHELLQRRIEARRLGYAESSGGTEPNISAIAYPVCWRNRVLGAINIIFFRSAMTPAKAAERYLDALHKCVRDIESELDSLPLGEYGWPRYKP
ncbi:MAG: IclR family transcriptional regulator domain-containing protein [Paenalcaligenes sp.]